MTELGLHVEKFYLLIALATLGGVGAISAGLTAALWKYTGDRVIGVIASAVTGVVSFFMLVTFFAIMEAR